MRRRRYLATTAALVAAPFAGCAHPRVVLTMDDVADSDIARRVSRTVDAHPEASAIVADAVENGSTTVSGRRRPLETDRPVAYGGAYYELSATETGQRETTEYSISIDYDPGTPVDGDATAYEELADVDRSALDGLLPPPGDPPSGDGYDFGVGRTFSEEELEASALVPDPAYDAVVFDGTRYPIRVGEGHTVTVSDYRYEADEVAADAATFAETIRSEYLFDLAGLSESEREIVEEAVDGGYYDGSTTDAFESLARRFRAHDAVEADEGGGEWLVRYDGTEYWAELQHPPSALEE